MAADAAQSLWQFIRLDQYVKPSEPAQETVRQGIFGLWDRLGWRKPSGPSFVEQNLGQVPLDLLDQVAPVPDWAEGVAGVTAALENWLDTEHPETPVQVFVGPSYSGTPQILGHWAQVRGWNLLAPPEPEQILAGGSDWLAQAEAEDAAPLVLTHLEHCYLRHYDGLTLLRRLLEIILSRQRRWLVGCGSWAWAFFSQVFKVEAMLPSPWILGPFDQDRLQVWLPQVAGTSGRPAPVFRQTDNGKFILPPASASGMENPDQSQAGQIPSPGLSHFLKYLAAYSRGIPGIAWAIWRHSLYLAMEQEPEETGEGEPNLAAGRTGKTIWVKPWPQLPRPTVPNLPERPQLLLVLHALMLHGGLWARIIHQLLPLNPMEIIEYLYLLEASGLVESDQGFWRVTPLGYPAVRQALVSEGYLVDAI
jgi:hypothetical protein